MRPFFLNAGGTRLEAVWHGPPPAEAPTLVFLHEGLGSVSHWRDFPEALAERTGTGALVYSRQGYGKSDSVPLPRPLDYMQREGQHGLPAVLREAGVRDFVLVGHSDGASIALVYAGDNPAPGLRGVVAEAPHVFCEDVSVRAISAAKDAFEQGDLREKLRRHHGDNVDGAFWGWNRAWPLLVIQGKDDEYGTVAQLAAISRQMGGGSKVVLLPDCGHAPHRDQPERALREMTDFIQRTLGRRTER
jgi:pimeloyl-ACP methyl ester carboxylesterase